MLCSAALLRQSGPAGRGAEQGPYQVEPAAAGSRPPSCCSVPYQLCASPRLLGPGPRRMATAEEFDYKHSNGVYADATNATEVDHDVEVVGWGVDEHGTKYWEVRRGPACPCAPACLVARC